MTLGKFKVEWFGDKVEKQIMTAADKAVLESAEDLQQRSSDEAPVDLGDLRGDAGIDDSELKTKGVVHMGYGLPYALRQHEELDYNHPKGGKAKFLEDPFNENVDRYEDHIAEAVDKASS